MLHVYVVVVYVVIAYAYVAYVEVQNCPFVSTIKHFDPDVVDGWICVTACPLLNKNVNNPAQLKVVSQLAASELIRMHDKQSAESLVYLLTKISHEARISC